MSVEIPTITLEIGKLQNDKYPLRLFFKEKSEQVEKALIEIDKAKFEIENWDFDPIEKFLDDPDASGDFAQIGIKLYSLISEDKIGEEWGKIAPALTDRCRIQLDIKPDEVAAFPWELVFKDKFNYLAVDTTKTFYRLYEPAGKVSLAEETPAILRVLIVVGADKNDPNIIPLQEIWKIQSVIHNQNRKAKENKLFHRIVDIDVLWQPDIDEIINEFQSLKPHIFHFIGHGGFDNNDNPFLELTSRNNQNDAVEWTHDAIFADFSNLGVDLKNLRFVFINACRSQNKALSEEQLRQQAWSIGDVFRKLQIPAVLTMQANIGGEIAGIFSGAVYESLAKLEPLDVALGQARNIIRRTTGTSKKRDWAIPVLTVAVSPDEILPFRPQVSDKVLIKIKECEDFNEIECFIDRAVPSRKLIQNFYPLPPEIPENNVTIVTGEEDSGKSWLVKWCLEVCSLLNNEVRYVEVGGIGSKTWLDLLLQIRGGYTSSNASLIHRELDPKHFEEFYWALQHYSMGRGVPPRDDSPVVPKDDYRLSESKWFTDFHSNTIDLFLQSLSQAASPKNPLIIVLDHFKGISEDDMKTILVPKLFEPIAEGRINSVKLILVFTKEEFTAFDIESLSRVSEIVPVELLSNREYLDIIGEYMRKINKVKNLSLTNDDLDIAEKLVSRILVKDRVSPSKFRELENFFQSFRG